MDKNHLLCFGYGYSTKFLAPYLIEKGWRITGTSRSEVGIADNGVTLVDFSEIDEKFMKNVTHIVISIPPDSKGDPVLIKFAGLIKDLENLHWVGYLSTTGVYGNTNGALVDENSPLNPTSKRSEYRLLAERSWLELHYSQGLPIHVFRLAGIYGVGRNIFKQVLEGRAQRVRLPGHKFSRIHVEDIVGVLIASIFTREPGGIYNVCDEQPAAQSDVVTCACDILNINPPDFIEFEEAVRSMTPMSKSFWMDNRRVDNRIIKTNLGISLLYPTYREGLRSIFESKLI